MMEALLFELFKARLDNSPGKIFGGEGGDFVMIKVRL